MLLWRGHPMSLACEFGPFCRIRWLVLVISWCFSCICCKAMFSMELQNCPCPIRTFTNIRCRKRCTIVFFKLLLIVIFCFNQFVNRESDKIDEDCSSNGKRQLKLSSFGVTAPKRKSEKTESSGKGRCRFFQARKLEQLSQF